MVSGNGQFGINVWWTCPVVAIDGQKAQEVLVKHGFDKDDLRLPSERTEVSRAAYSLQNRRGKNNRRVTEKAADDAGHVCYGILGRMQKGEEVGFQQDTKVVLDKVSGEVKVEGALADQVIVALHAYKGKVTDDDIRAFLRKCIRMCHGIPKRPSGGIYFVPAKYAHIMERAQAVLAELGSGARVYTERVVEDAEAKRNVWQAVEEEINARIEDTLMAVERIEKRVSAVQNQKDKLEELTVLMDVYRSLLGEEAKYECIAERIEEALNKVSEKMAKLQLGSAAQIRV